MMPQPPSLYGGREGGRGEMQERRPGGASCREGGKGAPFIASTAVRCRGGGKDATHHARLAPWTEGQVAHLCVRDSYSESPRLKIPREPQCRPLARDVHATCVRVVGDPSPKVAHALHATEPGPPCVRDNARSPTYTRRDVTYTCTGRRRPERQAAHALHATAAANAPT
jgi:hypothetical protein